MVNLSDISLLRSLLCYDPSTGDIVWLPREREAYAQEHQWRTFNLKRAGQRADRLDIHSGYRLVAVRYAGGEAYYRSHRLAWALHFGAWPTDHIDHINGNRSDNKLSNLRDVPRVDNARNMRLSCRNTSGASGVSFCQTRQRWVAKIRDGVSRRHLGYFNTAEEAIHARQAAEDAVGYHPNHGRASGDWVRGSKR